MSIWAGLVAPQRRVEPFPGAGPDPFVAHVPSAAEIDRRCVQLPPRRGLGSAWVTPNEVLTMVGLGEVFYLTSDEVTAAHARATALEAMGPKPRPAQDQGGE
jgi:hypothetical protein